jgi:hypothetical protein
VKDKIVERESLFSEFIQVNQLLEIWRQQRAAVLVNDQVNLELTAEQYLPGEIEEFVESSLNNGLSDLKTKLELVDILIFANALRFTLGISPQVFNEALSILSADGTKSSLSDLVSSLQSRAEYLLVKDPEKNITEFLQVWLQLASVLPEELNLLGLVVLKTKINGLNRPSQYYQQYDSKGCQLNVTELVERYRHTERCLRAIRDHFSQVMGTKVALQSWMHQPVAHWILDFRSSESYPRLVDFFENREYLTSPWAQAVFAELRDLDFDPDQGVLDRADLALKLQAVGGVLLETESDDHHALTELGLVGPVPRPSQN